MTLLSEATDEQINAECQARIDRGDRSPDVYCSRQQDDNGAKVEVLRTAIIRANVAAIKRGEPNKDLSDLAALCDKLDSIHGNPVDKDRIFPAINTTYYGQDPKQNHSPN